MQVTTSNFLKIIAIISILVITIIITVILIPSNEVNPPEPIKKLNPEAILNAETEFDGMTSGRLNQKAPSVKINNRGQVDPLSQGGYVGEGEDNATDTINTLIVRTTEMIKLQEKSEKRNASLERKIRQLLEQEARIEKKLAEIVTKELQSKGKKDEVKFKSKLAEFKTLYNQNNLSNNLEQKLFGIDSNESPIDASPQSAWIKPLSLIMTSPSDNSDIKNSITGIFSNTNTGKDLENNISSISGHDIRKQKNTVIKAYTIPMNATLTGSIALSALIGRIPMDKTNNDPYPFKVMVGTENLMANGIFLPELEGMIFSGYTSGDWTLSCVRGTIFSALFVFKDGRTLTYPYSGKGGQEAIGWLGDDFGVPCVSGERVTNAYSYLAQTIGMSAASGYYEALANAETTIRRTDHGGVVSDVTGDIQKYAQSRGISRGINEGRSWLEKRMSQSFDAIYVEPGRNVVLNIDRTLEIDLKQMNRKVKYDFDHFVTTTSSLD